MNKDKIKEYIKLTGIYMFSVGFLIMAGVLLTYVPAIFMVVWQVFLALSIKAKIFTIGLTCLFIGFVLITDELYD